MSNALSIPLTDNSSWRRRAMGWMGLVILGLSLVTAALASLRLSDLPSSGASADLPLGQIVICTGSGMRIVDMTAEGSAATPQQAQHPADELCHMCLPLSPAGLAVTVAAVAILLLNTQALSRDVPAPAANQQPRKPLACGATRITRGPPAVLG